MKSRRQITEPAIREVIRHYRENRPEEDGMESNSSELARKVELAWDTHDYRALRDLRVIASATCDALEAGEAGCEPADD